jgi:alpha-amylase/alpha-mannosidase (GH57 family)
MHQPFYKDLVTGEYKLPWTRMHALKDYYGMVKVLEDFPNLHQTFNLVPSMLVQIEEYASEQALDPFLRTALKPADTLTQTEQEFILQYFFQANPARMIYRYPRYGELYDLWLASGKVLARARRMMSVSGFRDLQVLSQLAWFDEEYHDHDELIRELVRKGRDFSLEDQRWLGRKQTESVARVLPVYKEFASRGQIEISTTPFYHPILPLICDSQIAEISHPYVALPPPFRYPQDARHQLETAHSYMTSNLDHAPAGLWPSEGSVSDEVLHLAAETGFQWFATDNGVLGRTLRQDPGPEVTYKPYVWEQGGHRIHGIFRDHFLSDLVGFVYARMGAAEAAEHFMQQIRNNCQPILSSGREALVPIILDGENAWEYYELNGRPFLRELYKRISADPLMSAVTVSEALSVVEAQRIDRIFPGSWINANFNIWIGAEEDNKAWEYLLRARQTYDRVVEAGEQSGIPAGSRELAYEELLIAEGSDWCWWYGPEHDSANRPEFDALFRSHLANVYKLLGLAPPDDLSRPILKVTVQEYHQAPTGPIRANLDGEVTSYFEWLGAGVYRVDNRSGAMHGQRFLVQELRYGSDGQNLFLRLDFVENSVIDPQRTELRINIQPLHKPDPPVLRAIALHDASDGAQCAVGKICEVRVALQSAGVALGHDFRFQISLWQGGLPVDALPPQGWIEFSNSESTEWLI